MPAYTTLSFPYGSVLTSAKMTQLFNNLPAVMQGDASAPAWSPVLPQGAFKSTYALYSFTPTGAASGTVVASAGGAYGFYPQIYINNNAWTAQLHGYNNGTGDVFLAASTASTTPVTPIAFGTNAVNTWIAYCRQQYIQASPPYDEGDGEIPLYIFARVDRSGKVISIWAAPEAPYHYNGGTNIKADTYRLVNGVRKGFLLRPVLLAEFGTLEKATARLGTDEVLRRLRNDPVEEVEITPAIKMADRNLLPHPFLDRLGADETVVLLDPVGRTVEHLAALHRAGDNVCDLIHADNIRLGNTPLKRSVGKGVIAVSANWR